MTERNQRLHSSASYRDAAERTTTFINDPVRLGTAIGAATALIALLALLQARIIGAVAERIPSTVTASIVVIALAAIVGTCAILLRRFGFSRWPRVFPTT